jgi:hypothetical protein
MNRRLSMAMFAGLVACGDGLDHDHHDHQPSGATCPTTPTTLSYESFGRAFFQSYCTRCHARAKTGVDRLAAPVDLNYDTLGDIQAARMGIDFHAAVGPTGANTAMPSSDPRPSLEERTKLGIWLACGAP